MEKLNNIFKDLKKSTDVNAQKYAEDYKEREWNDNRDLDGL